ncbi:2-haloalkanoic acid dehalogenase type II [Rhodoligotrophos appendicifer]|uniref:haloacid dehalogenase type II n=1 Tax=Rhodoligotrophos appendicifer TaxID=987056 RepID=UPI0011848460|nr:haloacid dehalogenase type II [Rhodoligotrophos appendicifer]
MRLSEFKALTFDCYGTLIDWESGIMEALTPLTRQVGRTLTRNEILEAHARQESKQQLVTPTKKYSELLAVVYKRLGEEWGVPTRWDECEVYGQSIPSWPAFPDSAEALRYLKSHYKLVVLSNVDNASFAASNEKLGVDFDAVYTAEDIGSYKPAARNFDYMIDYLQADLGVERAGILHTAESLFHDHVPATAQSLSTCWIYRRHEQDGFGATMNPGTMPSTNFRFTSMAALARAHQEEAGGDH